MMISPIPPFLPPNRQVYYVHRASSHHIQQHDLLHDDSTWKNVPWSAPFADITGEQTHNRTIPKTRFQALYNDTHLLLRAYIPSATGFSTEAHFTERNSPIYQKDSDIEVFIDPGVCLDTADSDTTSTCWNHNYKELELNAINTVWNLRLDKPYWDGGVEHSGRVAKDEKDPLYYEVYGQETHTKVLEGQLNIPGQGATWTAYMALAYSDLAAPGTMQHIPPKRLRVNWSRVEKQGNVNWTWQAQTRWDPSKGGAWRAYVDMHLPDVWGYFVFVADTDAAAAERIQQDNVIEDMSLVDPTYTMQQAAMCIYYAQHFHKDKHGAFATRLDDLELPTALIHHFDSVSLSTSPSGAFIAIIEHILWKVTVQEDRLITVRAVMADGGRASAADQ